MGQDEGSSGGFKFANETIADNVLAAKAWDIVDDGDALLAEHVNCIVYGNGGDIQTAGLGTTVRDALLADVTYSDWQGITSGTGNISSDPRFVNPGAGNDHLDGDPLSPCVDAGNNAAVPEGLVFDIDRDDRKQDGICPIGGRTVDMGCDELPEPDCGP